MNITKELLGSGDVWVRVMAEDGGPDPVALIVTERVDADQNIVAVCLQFSQSELDDSEDLEPDYQIVFRDEFDTLYLYS